MQNSVPVPRSALILRWIARLWGAVVLAVAVVWILTPDPYATEPVPAPDWFLLSLWLLAILGLALAWRWEGLGAGIAIAAMFLRELAFFLLKGFWYPAFLLFWVVIIPPALMFLAARHIERKARRAAQGVNQA